MKSIAQIKRRMEQLEKTMQRTKPIWMADQVVPGSFVTGRENYKMGKRLDAENTRKAKAFTQYEEARKEHERLTQLLKDVEAGERHPNGQIRADAPSRVASESRKQTVTDLLADYYKSHLKPGQLAGTIHGRVFEIKRINAKSITSVETWYGEPIKYEMAEVVPVEDGKPIETSELAKRVAAWMKSR